MERYLSRVSEISVWSMPETYRDTPFIEADPFTFVNTEYLSFSASSEALGITNKSFRITATGYITSDGEVLIPE